MSQSLTMNTAQIGSTEEPVQPSMPSSPEETWVNADFLKKEETLIKADPFCFLVGRDVVPTELRQQLAKDFPPMKGAGYLPYEEEECGPAVNKLIEQLTAPAFADPIGDALGIERMSQYPTYVSISRTLNKRHGRIHTDGKSKVATMLVYLNEEWAENAAGCLRFLKSIDDINDTVVPEVPPIYGTLVAFKRAENSFHGHLPFQGERRVIQVAWLLSADEKLRKAKRGRLSHGIKKLFGWFDRKLGSGRTDSAHTKM